MHIKCLLKNCNSKHHNQQFGNTNSRDLGEGFCGSRGNKMGTAAFYAGSSWRHLGRRERLRDIGGAGPSMRLVKSTLAILLVQT